MDVVWNKLPKREGRSRQQRRPLSKTLAMGLMEKPAPSSSNSSQRQAGSQDTAAVWGERGGEQHTQYLRRLVDLRDELISQEETALARALDRLRLHSITNRDAAKYRLKMKDSTANGADSSRPSAGAATQGTVSLPRSMMTTVEKFRQMRPQRRQPIIFPLQGKQLIDSAPAANGILTTRSSTEESARSCDLSMKRHSGGEDIASKAGLQRLMLPRSSIPNIGRKALKPREGLELKTQAIHSNHLVKGHKLSPRHQFLSPLVPLTHPHLHLLKQQEGEGGRDSGEGERDNDEEENGYDEDAMSPHAFQLDTMTDGDRLDMEKLNQYYYVYCLPDAAPASKQTVAFSNTEKRKLRQQAGSNPRRVQSERLYLSERTYSIRPYSDREIIGGVAASSDTESDMSAYTSYRYSKDSLAATANRGRVSLPVIGSRNESCASSPDADSRSQGGPVGDESSRPIKRHIVIDMPHIIYNCATPDGGEYGVVETLSLPDRQGTLQKTLKQGDIRHKELQNLLDDVKDLNQRTEAINTHSQGSELDPSSRVC